MCSALFSGAIILNAADRTDPQVRVVEEIVAKVNGKIITRGELEKQHERIQAELVRQGLTGASLKDATDKAASDALREQIDQLLLVQKASELNINVDSDVNKQIAKIQRESGIADPEKFHDWVRQNAGESFEDLKDTFKNNLLTQRVILAEGIYRTVVIPKAESSRNEAYDEHKADFVRQESVALREIPRSCRPTTDPSPAKVAAAVEAKGERHRGPPPPKAAKSSPIWPTSIPTLPPRSTTVNSVLSKKAICAKKSTTSFSKCRRAR